MGRLMLLLIRVVDAKAKITLTLIALVMAWREHKVAVENVPEVAGLVCAIFIREYV